MVDLIDTHTHLTAAAFDEDRAEVIERARARGVRRMITIGAGEGFESAEKALALAAEHPDIWCSVGVHPHDAAIPPDRLRLAALAAAPRVVAIGETGLDFHYDFAPREAQAAWFRAQIGLARELRKPIIVHCRLAAEECLAMLKAEHAAEVGGVFHCFSESAEFAARLREINFLVSIPGMVTFKRSENIRTAVRGIPLDQLMLETDAPYLAPEPFRGKRNETSFMVETARMVASLHDISLDELGRITTVNAEKLFRLGEMTS